MVQGGKHYLDNKKTNKMKFIPILMSTPMVIATIKEVDPKGMTRRTRGLTNIDHRATEIVKNSSWPKQGDWAARYKIGNDPDRFEVTNVIRCPYGSAGDILWVRETFITGSEMDENEYFKTDEHGDYISKIWYAADRNLDRWFDGEQMKENVPWKPSIHMPKAACRLFLEITDVRVERLQDISEKDVLKEGAGSEVRQMWLFGLDKNGRNEVYARSFRRLWEDINGMGSWNVNPWVWVISFKRIDKPSTFLQ